MSSLEPRDDDSRELSAAWDSVFRLMEERSGREMSEDSRKGVMSLLQPLLRVGPDMTPAERVRQIEAQARETMPFTRSAKDGGGMLLVPSMLESAVAVLHDLRAQVARAERQGRIDRTIGIAGFVIGVVGIVITLL